MCDTSPCSRESLDTATVVGWVDGVASSVSMDSRTKVVQVRSPVSAAPWPSPGSGVAPSADRPAVPDAPAEIAALPPLPSCGETEFDQPADRHACFRDAVLAGRPAELLEHTPRPKGLRSCGWTASTAMVRCCGTRNSGSWSRTAGALILEAATGGWSFDPWTDTRTVLPG